MSKSKQKTDTMRRPKTIKELNRLGLTPKSEKYRRLPLEEEAVLEDLEDLDDYNYLD